MKKDIKKESASIRFLYNTIPGRMALKLIVKPDVSKAAYYYMASPFSKWLIGNYKKKYDIDMSIYKDAHYKSFNDFFTREKKEIPKISNKNILVSPCDGFLSVYKISPESVFHVKHIDYSIQSLLENKAIADKYKDGLCLIYRLAPHNYHRYIFIDDGEIKYKQRIDGELHCVRPIVCEKLPVYIRNSREYALINNEQFGYTVQMEVGALLVGRICNHNKNRQVERYDEKGYFEFGGSTIIMLFEKDKVQIKRSIIENTAMGKETIIHVGDKIGCKKINL